MTRNICDDNTNVMLDNTMHRYVSTTLRYLERQRLREIRAAILALLLPSDCGVESQFPVR